MIPAPRQRRRDRRRIATPEFATHHEHAREKILAYLTVVLSNAQDAAGWVEAFAGANDTDAKRIEGIVSETRLLLRKIEPPADPSTLVVVDDAIAWNEISKFENDPEPWTPPRRPTPDEVDTTETPVVRIDSSTEDGLSTRPRPVTENPYKTRGESTEPGTVPIIVIDEDDVPEPVV